MEKDVDIKVSEGVLADKKIAEMNHLIKFVILNIHGDLHPVMTTSSLDATAQQGHSNRQLKSITSNSTFQTVCP